MTDTATTTDAAPDEIVARAGSYYRYTRYAFSVLLLAMAAWFGYDGFVKYPRDNALHLMHARDPKQYPQDYPTHDPDSILIQKALAATLPLAGFGMLGWTLYRSRGAYRLAGDVLRVPGHPPVPLEAITQIDLSQWDRKGIARLSYELPAGPKGTLTLDDFIYDRPPTDRILDAVKTKLNVTEDPAPAPSPDA